MASKYWIKLYHEILDDPKMGKLSDRLFRRAIQCFLMAGDIDKNGELPSLEDMAWRLRVDPDILETELVEMTKVGIITIEDGDYIVTNFMIRQMAMSNSERAKRWRQRNTGTQWAKKLYSGIPSSPGIYSMKCKKTGKRYIGATNNLQTRIRQNLYTISKDEHPMSSDILDYGIETIEIEVLELINDEKELTAAEQKWISQYPSDDLYNRETPKPHQNWKETDINRIANEKRTKRSQIKEEDIDTDIEIDTEGEGDTGKFGLLLTSFCQGTGIPEFMLQKGDTDTIRSWVQAGYTPAEVEQTIKEMLNKDLTIARPASLNSGLRIVRSKSKKGKVIAGKAEHYASWND